MKNATPSTLLRLCPVHSATPLTSLPRLAEALGVGAILAKEEGRRPLGSFKALGGVFAGLRALSRATGLSVEALLDPARPSLDLPALVCASDGNHGLAVAAAAKLAGARAVIYLPSIVPEARVARIAAKGAEIVKIAGTYDDAVRAADQAATDDGAILIADTGPDSDDPVIADVMAGYGVIAEEIRATLAESGAPASTHVFVQAGVGGLAAAMADGLADLLAPPGWIVVVEPESAACVGAALVAGHPVMVPGSLDTSAEMLSCGEASAPAFAILERHRAAAIAASEALLLSSPDMLIGHGGPATTPSGATGLAGLRAALVDANTAHRLGLGPNSRVLLLVTEGGLPA